MLISSGYGFRAWSRLAFTGAFLAVLLLPFRFAGAQVGTGDGLTVGVQGGKFGVGFASAWPTYGISGTYQLNETLTAEAILGFVGVATNISGRGWYRFDQNVDYDLYGYGMLGILSYRSFDTGLMFGFGGGIEAGIQELFDDPELPAIFGNFEIGIAFDTIAFYNLSIFSFGAGIHYRFGERN